MKILITGNKGFIASKLEAMLIENGHEVDGFDIADGKDILDLVELDKAVREVDVVYHLAAQADLTKMHDLRGAYDGTVLNICGTHAVAEACARHGIWLIYASTVCVYGNLSDHPAKEDKTLPNPSELYACTKYAAEWIVKGYGLNFGMPYTILRFATIYGPGMRPAMGMHIFFRQAMKNEKITVHGEGKQDRTLTYVDDLVSGCIEVLRHPKEAHNQVFNLTAHDAVSALTMAKDVKRITKSESKIISIPDRANQTFHEDFDITKTKDKLRWTAQTWWEEGLQKTYEWMKTQIS